MIIIGLILSFRDYNPGTFSTVHHFTIFCHLQTPHFLEVYGSGFSEWDWCIHNTILSGILYGIITAGSFLVYRSKICHKLL